MPREEPIFTVIYRNNARHHKAQDITPRPGIDDGTGVRGRYGAGLSFSLLTPDILLKKGPIVITTVEAVNATRLLKATNDHGTHYAIYPPNIVGSNLTFPNDVNFFQLRQWAEAKPLAQHGIVHPLTKLLQAISYGYQKK